MPQNALPALSIDISMLDSPSSFFINYRTVVHVIKLFNAARIAYTLDPMDQLTHNRWTRACDLMQNVLNQYGRLSEPSRTAVDICLQIWSATGTPL